MALFFDEQATQKAIKLQSEVSYCCSCLNCTCTRSGLEGSEIIELLALLSVRGWHINILFHCHSSCSVCNPGSLWPPGLPRLWSYRYVGSTQESLIAAGVIYPPRDLRRTLEWQDALVISASEWLQSRVLMADQTPRCLFVMKRVRFLRLKRPGAAAGAAR